MKCQNCKHIICPNCDEKKCQVCKNCLNYKIKGKHDKLFWYACDNCKDIELYDSNWK